MAPQVPLSNLQYSILWIGMEVSSLLSIIASSSIIRSTYHQTDSLYHRLLLVLSICEVVNSVNCLAMPWMLPQDAGLPWTFGNDYNWSNKEISQRRERWWYASVVCLATVPPITAAAYDRIHTSETVLLCMVASGPSGCSYDNEGECNTSQDTVGAISAYIAILTVLIFAVASFCLTFTVFRTVRAKFASSARFSFQGSTNEGASEQVRIVRNKCVLYSLGYLNTFLPVLFSAIVSEVFFTEDADNQEFNALIYSNQLLAWFFMPLQGCFNALVYFEWLPCLKKRKTKRDSDKTASATTLSTTASATAAVAEDVEYVQNT